MTPTETDTDRPWEQLAELVAADDGAGTESFLEDLSSEEQRLAVSHLSGKEQATLVGILNPDVAAGLLENLPEAQASDILEDIAPEAAADIVEELHEDISADLIREMGATESEAVLAEMDDVGDAEHLRERVTYAWDTAGGLMTTKFAAFPDTSTVGDVHQELSDNAERYGDLDVQYVYVTDREGVLQGVLRLRDLVLKPKRTPVPDIMLADPISVKVDDDFETLQTIFGERAYVGLPVVNGAGVIEGVVTAQALREATADHQTEDYLLTSGIVGGEELRSMPMLHRSRRRLAWLAPNIVLNLIAASIIAMYEDTLQAVIALAVFLPIISDMSGCSGNQAVAVSIRELTLGLIRPNEFLRIVWKEGFLGIINGLVLGLLLGTIAALWKDNLWLGVVVGGALTLNTLVSVTLGGMVPLLLKKLKADPALASGPILTTCTDMCGFFLVLSLASTVLSRLT